jgi:multidrug efflux pump subunit AcrA (membrane-fusion protein)
LQIAPESSEAGFKLLEGTNVVVRMQVTSSQDVLILPNDAIQTVAGRNYVVVRDSDFLRDQEIAIGLTGDTHTQILDGLSAGMEIVAP